jgi:hypothetical protein
MMRLDPRRQARGLIQDRAGRVGGTVINDDPARRRDGCARMLSISPGRSFSSSRAGVIAR